MRLLQSSVIYLIAAGANRGLPFLLLPLLTRYLSVQEFGRFGIATAAVSILAIVIGMNPFLFVVARFHRTAKDQLASYIFHMFMLALASGAVVFGLFLVGRLRWHWSEAGVMGFGVLCIVALNRVTLNIGLAVLQMERRVWDYALLSGLMTGLTLLWFWMLILRGDLHWISIFLAECVAGTIVSALVVRRLWLRRYITLGFRWADVRALTHFLLPLVPHVLALWAMNSIDRFFIARMVGLEAVGIYSAAYTLGLGLSLIHESLVRAWQPYFFEYLEDGGPEAKRLIVRYTWMYGVGSALLFVVFVGFVRLAFSWLVSAEYQDAARFVPLVGLAYTALGLYRVMAGYLYQSDKTAVIAGITVLSAFVNIVLNYVLIPLNGALGAAQATLAAFALSLVLVTTVVVKRYKMPWLRV